MISKLLTFLRNRPIPFRLMELGWLHQKLTYDCWLLLLLLGGWQTSSNLAFGKLRLLKVCYPKRDVHKKRKHVTNLNDFLSGFLVLREDVQRQRLVLSLDEVDRFLQYFLFESNIK